MKKIFETLSGLSEQGYKPINDKNSKHFSVIGKIIISVSMHIDSKLNFCLRSQVDDSGADVMRAMVGQMRAGDMMQSIRRIAISRNISKTIIASIDDLFKEISVFHNIRDNLAHGQCWVSGSSIIFHNIFSAKSDDNIKLVSYSIAELTELYKYFQYLGYKIDSILANLIPKFISPATTFFIASTKLSILLKISTTLILHGNLTADNKKTLKDKSKEAHEAVCKYSESARIVDPTLIDHQRKVEITLTNLSVCVSHLSSSFEIPLPGIPALLQRKDHRPRAGILQGHSRQPASSAVRQNKKLSSAQKRARNASLTSAGGLAPGPVSDGSQVKLRHKASNRWAVG